MGFFDPDEMEQLEALARENQQRQVAASAATAQQAAMLAAWQQQYPYMSANVVVPLAQAGIEPGSPTGQAAASAEVKRKGKRGFGWHSLGDAVKATGGGLKDVGSAVTPDFVGETLNSSAVKGTVRNTFMALDAVPQALQGGLRETLGDGFDASDAWRLATGPVGLADLVRRGADQTDAAETFRQATDDTPGIDQGSGFFVGGSVRSNAIQRRREAAPLIDGHAWSLGRYVAQSVVEPGSKPYNVLSGLVDGAVLIGADPSTYVGGGPTRQLTQRSTSLTRDAGKGFARDVAKGNAERIVVDEAPRVRQPLPSMREQAGLVDGQTRRTILPDRASEWLQSAAGQRIVNFIADNPSYTELRRTFKGKIDEQTLVKLADARSTQEVYDILGPQLGVDLVRAPVAGGISRNVAASLDRLGVGNGVNATSALPMTITRPLGNVRMAGMMPGRSVDLRDADDSVEQLDRFLRNAKVPLATREELVEKMARAENRNERLNVMTGSMTKTINHLRREYGIGADTRYLTKMWADYDKRLTIYYMDEIGNNAVIPGVRLDGAGMAMPAPHLHAEFLNRAVPLPDARDIRRAASRFKRIFDVPGVSPGVAALDGVTQQMFKPMALIRGAWTIRVIGEEQVRLAAAGLNSAFLHPLSHIAMAVSADGKAGRALGRVGVKTGRASTDLRGADLREAQEYLDALSKGSNDFRDSTRSTQRRGSRKLLATSAKVPVARGEDGYARAWLDELADLHHDPLASRLALGRLREGDGNLGTGIDGIKEWYWRGDGSRYRLDIAGGNENLLTRRGSDAWVDSYLARVQTKTKGDLELTDIVAHGRFRGEQVFTLTGALTRQQSKADKELLKELNERAARMDYDAPEKVKGDFKITAADRGAGEFFERYDAVVENMFNTLMSRPTNFLSRSPAFKQFYWQRAADLVQHMTPAAQRVAIQNARLAKMPKDVIAKMEGAARTRSGKLTLDDADHLAKGHGLDSTRKLLYDLHDRSQFFDINRTLMPFGEAWKEVATTWARLGMENPFLIRRAGQVINAGRSGDLDGDGQGFFYPDPNTGEEMFAFPLSEYFSKKVTGVPAPMSAPVKSLNIFGQSVLPGFGPVVQVAAGRLLPDDPSFDGLREIIIPYGETDTSGGVFESLFPAWLKKVQASGTFGDVPFLGRAGEKQERQYANMTKDVATYLLSSDPAKYDMSTPEGQELLLRDAKKKASRLLLIRGLAQNVAPSPPVQNVKAQSKEGDLVYVWLMAKEFRKLQDEDYRTATEKFIARFGEDAFLATISKTTGGGPVSSASFDFERRNPDVAAAYPDLFAYFAKPDPEGKFDQTAYQRQLDTGRRKTRELPDAIELANQRVAASIYRQAKAMAGERPTDEGKAWLRQLQDRLVEEYQGYTPVPSNLADTPKLIQQAIEASRNETLAATPAGKALVTYVQAREKALAAARQMGLQGFASSDRAAGIRQWLRQLGEQLVVEEPEFAGLYDEVLTRELGED